jgi:peptide-methionine (S)-S-oxide reductase
MKKTDYKKAYLAGGCFWGMEELFRKQDGVVDTQVGYMGGLSDDPTYRNHQGHAEAIEVSFDPEVTSYQKVLDFFFTIHDPTTKDRQGNDRGDSYRSAIFYQTSDEKIQAEAMVEIVNRSGRWMSPVVTNLEEFK